MYFKIGDKFAIGAEYYETSRSWGHKAHLYRKTEPALPDEYILGDKIRYYNRTWERYQFQSIMSNLVGKAFKKHLISPQEYSELNKFIEEYQEPNRFNHVVTVAKLGEMFTETKKEANTWKERMLKAGLPEGAVDMPEDWATLTEDEKEVRLNGAIQALSER